MKPTINVEIKQAYERYCANPQLMSLSYEQWLEGRLNHTQWELRQAQDKLNKVEAAPDAYHTALEQVDKLLEDGMPKVPAETLFEAQSNLHVLRIHVYEARQVINAALGGTDEVFS